MKKKPIIISIKKFKRQRLTMTDLLNLNSLAEESKEFLEQAVKSKCNIIISGGTSAGKTALITVLGDVIPDDEKVVALEDSREIELNRTHFVPLELRNAENHFSALTSEEIGKIVGFIFSRDLPDRILFGEFREGGILETVFGAKYTNKSIMGTVHSITPDQALDRLTDIASTSFFHYNETEFKETMGEVLDLIVQINRLKDGSRKITQISQIIGYDSISKKVQLEDLFVLDSEYNLIRTKSEICPKLQLKMRENN